MRLLPGSDLNLPSRLPKVSGIAAALVLTAFSAMLHGSGAEARLQGPSGWTGWVTLDLMLAVLPLLVLVVSFVALAVARLDRRASGAIADGTTILYPHDECSPTSGCTSLQGMNSDGTNQHWLNDQCGVEHQVNWGTALLE